MGKEDDATGVEEETTPEEKCQQLMEHVVKMRTVYSNHVSKIDEEITKHNIISLKKRLKYKKYSVKKRNVHLYGDSLMKELKKLQEIEENGRKMAEEMNTLIKIQKQLDSDTVGQIVRKGIDSATILIRVKSKMNAMNLES